MNEMGRGLRDLGIPFVEPGGAFYFFPDVGEFGSGEEACRLFMAAGVMSMPGSVFHESCAGHVRMSFTAERDDIREAMARIEGVIA